MKVKRFIKSKYMLVIALLVVGLIYTILSIIVIRVSTKFPADLLYLENEEIYDYDEQVFNEMLSIDFLEFLDNEFGEENITKLSIIQNYNVFSIYAIDNNFLETGVTAFNLDLKDDVIERTKLLYGDIWEEGSTDKVTVVDETVADYYGISEDNLGTTIRINDLYFEVIGIVSDTGLVGSDNGNLFYEQYISVDFDKDGNIYLPFYFNGVDLYTEEYNYKNPGSIIIKSDNYYNTKDDFELISSIVNKDNDYIHLLHYNSLEEIISREVFSSTYKLTILSYYAIVLVIYFGIKKGFYKK